MNERIRLLRETLKLSRSAFGEKLGVSGDVINNLERGRVSAKASTIKLICSCYGVSEKWLETGEGTMFAGNEPEPLDALLKDREIPERDLAVVKSVVAAFLELEETSRQEVIRFVQSCAEKLNAPAAAPPPDSDLAAKVDALERQNRELIARLEAIEKDEAETETPEPAPQSVTRSPSH